MPTNLLSDKRDECLKHLRYIICRVVTARPLGHIEKYVHDVAPEKYPVRVLVRLIQQLRTMGLGI
jgi:hypothetical protein